MIEWLDDMAKELEGQRAAEAEGTEGAELGVPCQVYSRIVGYVRPVGSWARHKQDEFWHDRVVYQVPEVKSGRMQATRRQAEEAEVRGESVLLVGRPVEGEGEHVPLLTGRAIEQPVVMLR